jgi:hypothetical protein
LLEDRVRILGPDDRDTLWNRDHLARWIGEAGDPTAAVAAYEHLLADRSRILGPEHPDTLKTRQKLDQWRTR